MHKAGFVSYIDPFGKKHEALVRAVNGQHPGYVDLAFIDEKLDERENVVTVYAVAHADDESKWALRTVKVSDPNSDVVVVDGNPELPHYDLNCWIECDEHHLALPADHPAFDNPFVLPVKDQDGNIIPIDRPEYQADIDEHRERLARIAPTAEDLDAVAEEEAVKDATASSLDVFETKHYSDGSSATGVAPLPDQSPDQQVAADAGPVLLD